jgi:hypothetical protein
MIFLDPTGSAGTGTYASPTNSLTTALGLLSATRSYIYIKGGPVQISSGTTAITSAVANAKIVRSSTYDGFLFNLNGGTTNVSNITIDGNSLPFEGIPSPTSSLFNVAATATLNINGGATLQNNFASDGGALRVMGGTVVMNGGLITGNESAINGGAVSVHDLTGSFTLNGGSISANSANNDGGAVATYNKGQFAMTGGTVASNTAGGNGGALIVGSQSGADTISGGNIVGNTATLGNGIYDTSTYAADGTTPALTLSPTAGALYFGSSDAIYLPNTTGAVGGQVAFYVGSALNTGVVGTVPLTFQTPLVNAVVATAVTDTVAGSSIASLISTPIKFGQPLPDSPNIIITSLTQI